MPVDPYFLGGSDGGEYQGETPCPDCGYDLRGLSIGARCPECGAAPQWDPVLDEPPETMIDPRFLRNPDGSDPGLPDGGDADDGGGGRRCGECGYDLQGLPAGSRCPECGIDFDAGRERIAVRSDLIPEDVANSSRWRWGLLLLIASTAGYIGFGLWGLFPSDTVIHELGTIVCLGSWGAGCWLAIPRSVCGGSSAWEAGRIAGCAAQLLWLPMYLLTWIVHATGSSRPLELLAGVLGFGAVAGLIIVLALLCRMAGELYFRDTARLLGHMVWIAVPVAIIDWWFPWPSPGGEALFDTRFGVLGTAVLLATLLPLYIIPLVVCVTGFRFLNYSLWSVRQSRRRLGREERIRDKKSALQEEAVDDLPRLEVCRLCGMTFTGRSCTSCGPNEPPSDIPLA